MGDATVAALAVSARALSAVTMATPVDPIVTAIARDRSHKPMRARTKPPAASGRTLVVNLRMTAFGVRSTRAVLSLAARDDP
jgi:hypothetical protein